MRKHFLSLVFIIALFGCMTNKQTVELPDKSTITVTTPRNQKTPAEVSIVYTSISNDVVKVMVDTTTGSQHDSVFTKASLKNLKIYHYGAVALFILGAIMIGIKRPPSIWEGVCLIVSAVAIAVLGTILPVVAQYGIYVIVSLFMTGVLYVILYRFKDKKKKVKV